MITLSPDDIHWAKDFIRNSPRAMASISVYIDNLENQIEALEEERGDLLLWKQAMEKLMSCGHAARYAVHADEGTAWCAMCEAKG